MKFTVTGGAGFIGSHLARILVLGGHDVTVVDNLIRGNTANLGDIWGDIHFEKVDIRDPERLDEALVDTDGIFHQAALGFVPESWNSPSLYQDINVNGTKNVFQIASRRRIKVVYASSSSVYGNVQSVPIAEDVARRPISPYGRTKLDCEILAEKYSKMDGVSIIGLRYFNVFGPGENPNYTRVIPRFLGRLSRGKQPVIFGDESRIKDFTFVLDVAEANVLAMSSGIKSGFLNIGGGSPVTLRELARIMISMSGMDMEPLYDRPRRGDPMLSAADITKAANMLGWKPKTSLKDGLRAMMGNSKIKPS